MSYACFRLISSCLNWTITLQLPRISCFQFYCIIDRDIPYQYFVVFVTNHFIEYKNWNLSSGSRIITSIFSNRRPFSLKRRDKRVFVFPQPFSPQIASRKEFSNILSFIPFTTLVSKKFKSIPKISERHKK